MKFDKWNQKKIIEYLKTKTEINIFFLYGQIGVGKTTFIRNFISNNELSSPTFVISNIYEPNFWHFDLFRVDSTLENLENLGFFYAAENGTVFVEWSEKIDKIQKVKEMYKTLSLYFSKNTIEISF